MDFNGNKEKNALLDEVAERQNVLMTRDDPQALRNAIVRGHTRCPVSAYYLLKNDTNEA